MTRITNHTIPHHYEFPPERKKETLPGKSSHYQKIIEKGTNLEIKKTGRTHSVSKNWSDKTSEKIIQMSKYVCNFSARKLPD
ncbi:MAG TPA: hypothetical protein P5048_01645 [Chlamydiales bacterium]|nr:hypothetical protein [Chlamydiales bacterium]